jgi:signal transduction histidine kinase
MPGKISNCAISSRTSVAIEVGRVSQQSESALVEAESLIAHLQSAAEVDRAALARELHDELGGLMVSAIMDLGSVQLLQPEMCSSARERLERVKTTLEAAIDLKRRVIEDLRPSILDNFGLFAALRWHLKRLCQNSNMDCAEHYPDIEPPLEPDVSIALFRIAEEALAMTLKRGSVTSTELHIQVAGGILSMSVLDDGTPVTGEGGDEIGASTSIASMRHRLRVLGGKVEVRRTHVGGTILTATMPLASRSVS